MSGIHAGFIQEGPILSNSYETDGLLKAFLKWKLPQDVITELAPELVRFGSRCVGEIYRLGELAESQPPVLKQYDSWGRRIDQIELSLAWQKLDLVSAEEGLVAIGYERKSGEYSRLHQFAKIFLFHPSSAFYTCPLAMTDGAARVIELHGTPDMKTRAFKNLTSRNPGFFWTSGQWMTEKTGGSDVSSTSTIARRGADGRYRLYGDKWFTSATTAQMAMVLAKVDGAKDSREGLSLFYVELRDENGRLNNLRINRLKHKLGTQALPTAELTLEGLPGELIGEVGEGVRKVASILNITRLYNSVTALGTMARALSLVRDYSHKRIVFGRPLAEQPLHLQTMAGLHVEYEAVFVLGFHLAHLLGKDETAWATSEENTLLRLLTPILKLWSAKQAIITSSEAIECFGGAGYVEDTGIARLLRDSQVYSIWEGTTNVLSLDVLRAISKDNALAPFFSDVTGRISRVRHIEFAIEINAVQQALVELKKFNEKLEPLGAEVQAAGAREFAFGLGRVYAASLLLEFGQWCLSSNERPQSAEIAKHFCRKPLLNLPSIENLEMLKLRQIVG